MKDNLNDKSLLPLHGVCCLYKSGFSQVFDPTSIKRTSVSLIVPNAQEIDLESSNKMYQA